MRTLFGAVAGALALIVVLVAYDLGERRSFSRDMTLMPTTQTMIGPDGVARTYLVPAAQATYGQAAYGQAPYGQAPYGTLQNGWSPYASAAPGMIPPYGAYPVQAQYVTDGGVVTQQPVVRRVSSQRTVVRRAPQRSWQKSALLIGGSASAGAGLGGLLGGKRGALSGLALGGGIAALVDQAQRH